MLDRLDEWVGKHGRDIDLVTYYIIVPILFLSLILFTVFACIVLTLGATGAI